MISSEFLKHYTPFDSAEASAVAELRAFLAAAHTVDSSGSRDSILFSRDVAGPNPLRGHITVTSWIMNITLSQTLLAFHAKTAAWLPPGEHCDGNTDLPAMALQIAQRATGLQFRPLRPGLFDVNVRLVPEYWNTPEHRHYELCFALQPDELAPSSGTVSKTRWVPLQDIASFNSDQCLKRLIAKTQRLSAQI